MSYLVIPVSSDDPAYQFQIALEGVTYTLAFHYNLRADRWTMDILDQSGQNPIIMGMVLVAQVLLNLRFKASAGGPPGDFYLVDTQDGNADPGISDLGTRFILIYRESTTIG